METLDTSVQVFNPREPIAGYVLQNRIGAGGFGEVWKAQAPGGLNKAVKIVYGQMNASKAERELKALNRVKQVHHPLLLSLERIESVQGHLVIVTELAESSLMDRFKQCQQEGLGGIPRAELLSYMQDAAEALDYLYEKHSLQHLDVKPENLLLLANRIKVADFGMVKDLQESCETLVGGLTPLYAPPEIYDGQPTRTSDQYSLAIVYQQMLTSELPFAGRTTAQLAAQHLHSDPDLSALSDSDAVVVGRALSKDPRQRFTNCREMVAALAEPPRAAPAGRPRRNYSGFGPSAFQPGRRRGTTTSTVSVPTAWPCETNLEILPALDDAPRDALATPTLFVGIGEMAGRILQLLKRQIGSRLATLDELPALQFRLLDTDASALADATRGDPASSFRLNETVAMPLREAAYYRNKSDKLLEWLHRRWLYNIPRTLCTEGIRSLGRLAFVDHFVTIEESLREAVLTAVSPEAVAQSSGGSGRAFRSDRLQVFVVGSAAGGTSSGSILDLAYALRHMLSELGLSDDELVGLLLVGTRAGGRSRDLQIANSLALLRELACLNTAGSPYPGEPDCGIPSFVTRAAPFAHTYLVDLGQDLTAREFDAQAGRLAEYLYDSSISPAAPYFAAARAEEPFRQFPAGKCRVRTFSLANLGGDTDVATAAAESLCRAVVRRWTLDSHPPQELEVLAGKLAKGLALDDECLGGLAVELTSNSFAPQAKLLLQAVAEQAQGQLQRDLQACDLSILVEAVDRVFLEQRDDIQAVVGWRDDVAQRLRDDAEQRIGAIQEWVGMLSRQPGIQPVHVRAVLRWFAERLDRLESGLVQATEKEVAPAPSAPSAPAGLLQVAQRRWQWLALRQVILYVRSIRQRLQETDHQWKAVLRQLDEFAAEFATAELNDPQSEEARLIESRRWQLVDELDGLLKRTIFAAPDAWLAIQRTSTGKWRELAAQMRQHALRLVADTLSRHKIAQLVEAGAGRSSVAQDQVTEWLRSVRPRLRCCGGKERALVLVPGRNAAACQSLAHLLQQTEFKQATLIPASDEGITVAFELSEMPLENVLVHLAAGRREYLELAARLHTRKDIQWGP